VSLPRDVMARSPVWKRVPGSPAEPG